MAEWLFPLDSAGASWVTHSSHTESPEADAPVGHLAWCCSVEAASTCSLHPSAWSKNCSAIRSCACCNFWPVTVYYLFTSPIRVSTLHTTEKFIPFNRETPVLWQKKKKCHVKFSTLKTSEKGFCWWKQRVITALSEFIVPVSAFQCRISQKSCSR